MKLTASAKLLVKSQCRAVLGAQDPLGSSGRWPMPKLKSTNEASIFSEPFVAEALYKAFLTLEKQGYSAKDVGEFMPWPSVYARLAFIFRSRPVWKLTHSQQVDLMNRLAESLRTKYKSDPYCLGGKNQLLNRIELNVLGKKLKISRNLDPKLVSQLDARLWMYTEMLYSRWHNLGHEFHGPYRIKGQSLLIKEWHDLDGFRNFMGKFSASHIICYEFFSSNTVKLDLHNRLWTGKPFSLTATRCIVEVDGGYATTAQVRKLMAQIDKYLAKGARYLEQLTARDLKVMNAEMEFYAMKELLEKSAQSIFPPRELISKIRHSLLSRQQKKLLEVLSKFYKRITLQNLRVQFNPSAKFKLHES